MTREEKARAMILLGALLDIADKSHEPYTKKQIIDIERKLESVMYLKIEKEVKEKQVTEFDYWNKKN